VGELLAQLHAPDLAYHFHGDHFLALLLKYSAEQLNTLVNFESALLGLDGQFSVGGNNLELQIDLKPYVSIIFDCLRMYISQIEYLDLLFLQF
jgi:hypothetical protein